MSQKEVTPKERESYALGSIEMKSDPLKIPAFEKHTRKGRMVKKSEVGGGSARMMPRMSSRASEALRVIGTMVNEEEKQHVVEISFMGLKKERDS